MGTAPFKNERLLFLHGAYPEYFHIVRSWGHKTVRCKMETASRYSTKYCFEKTNPRRRQAANRLQRPHFSTCVVRSRSTPSKTLKMRQLRGMCIRMQRHCRLGPRIHHERLILRTFFLEHSGLGRAVGVSVSGQATRRLRRTVVPNSGVERHGLSKTWPGRGACAVVEVVQSNTLLAQQTVLNKLRRSWVE